LLSFTEAGVADVTALDIGAIALSGMFPPSATFELLEATPTAITLIAMTKPPKIYARRSVSL